MEMQASSFNWKGAN